MRGKAPAARLCARPFRPPPPATHLHILPRQGMGGPSGPGPGWPASPRCSRTSYAANPMRAPFPPPFPPLPAIFQPAGRLRMPAVPVRLGRGTACPPCFETPGASSAAPHHRRACLLSAASAGTSARAGAAPAPAPGPARTRQPPCAPQGRRIPSTHFPRPGRPAKWAGATGVWRKLEKGAQRGGRPGGARTPREAGRPSRRGRGAARQAGARHTTPRRPAPQRTCRRRAQLRARRTRPRPARIPARPPLRQ